MGLQPSASKTELLLACSRPFSPEVEIERDAPTVAMRYGSAFHEITATALRKKLGAAAYARVVDRAAARYDVRPAAQELAGHVRSSLKVLQNWLARERWAVEQIETSYAISSKGARAIEAPSEDGHHYEVRKGEVPGTLDLLARRGNATLVLDHKTGQHDPGFAFPARLPQMRTLGLIPPERREVHVGILHADRQGLPMIYSEELEPKARQEHARALVVALGRIGDGSLRPGPWCGRCPARSTCPARSADILADSTAALLDAGNVLLDEPANPATTLAPRGVASVEVRAAALYTLLKRFRALDKAGSAEIKRLVREGKIIETPGGALIFQSYEQETLSKSTIVRALGKGEGEKLIEGLRRKGVVETATHERLVPSRE
jgi:hypothetical protein